ncbi:MAG: TIGR00341 family protein [Pedobacter sp.]|jgi:uncharacterized hydrophobic protein (TIGR00271 family)|uniref:TIGR00341 family protein n=1 Tax=Pedobacter sp. TaxID=1411316 RepID=UPI003568D19C
MKEIFNAIGRFVSYRFSLRHDNAEESDTVESIISNVEFKGANLWTLIFAIFIASIGLNLNSTAVIIGAMLVSPLMGPIMGIGLGIGTNDFDLVKKGARNLAIATVFSIATSSLYFYVTPLHDASSELLARTSPSIWDVFIAGFGGLAGIVAATRKVKSNVIPGVAIATALMPPLCTAGFGIASGNLYFFLGAIYLYFINSIFICVATYIIVRYLKFRRKEFQDREREKKVRRYILIIVLLTSAPSVYLAYRIVDRSLFENNAKSFIQNEMNYKNTQVISKNFKYSRSGNEINLLLLGAEISPVQIDSLKKKMSAYKLDSTRLVIRQGLSAKNELDLSQIKASILESVYQNDSTHQKSAAVRQLDRPIPEVGDELHTLYPDLLRYSINNVVVSNLVTKKKDTLALATMDFVKTPARKDRLQMEKWLKKRIGVDSLKLVLIE